MKAERRQATMAGIAAALVLAASIILGSRNLARFDAALLGYTFATLFAAFGITYRWVMWLERPPTAMYWRRGVQLLLRPGDFGRHGVRLLQRLLVDFAGNRFIWRRGRLRGAAHWCIMWGCVTAFAITFPLVFGWVHFETVPGDLTQYRVQVFGLAAGEFAIASLLGFLIFHGLVWSSLLVIAGVLLALRRRLRDDGVVALQQFSEDFLPLLLLFAISVTGLLLTVSYTWMHGYAYEFLALLHAATVIFTLLWLPFGKLFHIFMRPAHLAVAVYKDAGREGEPAHCRRCNAAFASRMHIEDLITVQKQLGYRYEIESPRTPHYQWICPPCRRALVCLAHTAIWEEKISPQRSQRAQREEKKANRVEISPKFVNCRSPALIFLFFLFSAFSAVECVF
jgi:nitrate reductase gamma subunit